MGIFTGIEILFFALGVITTLLTSGIITVTRKFTVKWYSWITIVTGSFLLVFTVAWSVASVLENEPQAANMGVMVFGIPALLLLGVTQRFVRRDSAAASASEKQTSGNDLV